MPDNQIHIKISHIYIRYSGRYIKIKNHKYFKALATGNRHTYEEFINRSDIHQRRKPSASWEGINKLIDKIREEGFDPSLSSFQITKKTDRRTGKSIYIVDHGRHRMCILRYLYGRNLQFIVDKHGFILDLSR